MITTRTLMVVWVGDTKLFKMAMNGCRQPADKLGGHRRECLLINHHQKQLGRAPHGRSTLHFWRADKFLEIKYSKRPYVQWLRAKFNRSPGLAENHRRHSAISSHAEGIYKRLKFG